MKVLVLRLLVLGIQYIMENYTNQILFKQYTAISTYSVAVIQDENVSSSHKKNSPILNTHCVCARP